MPREVFRSFTAQEQKFIFHFLREGAVEERVWIVEKKARLPKGDGAKMLKRKHVMAEIERRKAQVELEQAKLIARDQSAIAKEEDKRQSVTLDKLEQALDSIIALDAKTHGAIKLAAIQTGLVYTGTIRSGRMERTAPPPPPDGKEAESGASFYDSVFDRLRAEQGEVTPAPLMPAAPSPLTPAFAPDPRPKTSTPLPLRPVPPNKTAAQPPSPPKTAANSPQTISVTIT